MGTIYDSNYKVDPVPQQPTQYTGPLQHVETLKDIFQQELERFFTTENQDPQLLSEVPNITKYQVGVPAENQQEGIASVTVIRQLPDLDQKLPLIAITTATGKTRSLGVGNQFVGTVQEPPRLQTSTGPWNVPQNGQLLFQTRAGYTVITLTPLYIANFARAMPSEVAAAINSQTNRLVAVVQPDSSILIQLKNPDDQFITVVQVVLQDFTGTSAPADPSGYLTIDQAQMSGIPVNGANADATAAFGLRVGMTDDITNPLRPPKKRYNTSKEMILNLDIGCEDDNQRTELTDLLFYFIEMRLNERDFTLLGDPALGQNWQIVLKKDAQITGEAEIPRPENDSFSKIYVNRISIPVTIIDYIDRPAVVVNPTVYSDQIPMTSDQ